MSAAVEDLAVELEALGAHMTREAWTDWLASPPDVQARVVEGLTLAAVPPSPDYWGGVLSVLLVAAQVVGAVAGVASGVGVVKAVLP